MSIAGWVIFGVFVFWCLGFVRRHFSERVKEPRAPQAAARPHSRVTRLVPHVARKA